MEKAKFIKLLQEKTIVLDQKTGNIVKIGQLHECVNFCYDWINQRFVDFEAKDIVKYFKLIPQSRMTSAEKILYGIEDDAKE